MGAAPLLFQSHTLMKAAHPLPAARAVTPSPETGAKPRRAASTVPTILPFRLDSSVLAKHRQGDEPMVVVKACGIGAIAPFELRDTGTRVLVMRWDSALGGHTLRVPLSVWMANKAKFAHELMDQRRLPHPLVVLIDTGVPVAPALDDDGKPVVLSRRPRRPRPPNGGDWPDAGLAGPPGVTVDGPPEQGPSGEAPLITEIKRLIADGNKRAGDLAELLPADEDVVRDAINSKGSGLHVVGGWVKLVEAPTEG